MEILIYRDHRKKLTCKLGTSPFLQPVFDAAHMELLSIPSDNAALQKFQYARDGNVEFFDAKCIAAKPNTLR